MTYRKISEVRSETVKKSTKPETCKLTVNRAVGTASKPVHSDASTKFRAGISKPENTKVVNAHLPDNHKQQNNSKLTNCKVNKSNVVTSSQTYPLRRKYHGVEREHERAKEIGDKILGMK